MLRLLTDFKQKEKETNKWNKQERRKIYLLTDNKQEEKVIN